MRGWPRRGSGEIGLCPQEERRCPWERRVGVCSIQFLFCSSQLKCSVSLFLCGQGFAKCLARVVESRYLRLF